MLGSPLLAVYVLGAYGWLVFAVAGMVLQPYVVDMLAREAGLPRTAFMALVLVSYSVLWPLTACAILAQALNDRRGGGDG
ncbi:hypothetical protein GCM10009530_26690 [Microbispora corallina]|uniref:MFS transporter n=1 Tax=Microbispora corallina TaxID=83302 RepID=A0ABQ4G4Z2_9ACTN|nr:hypothetical protein [Microbispora corallina]GIH42150.1 hypothetical protein Mco01_51500 [Microbispora corallina]